MKSNYKRLGDYIRQVSVKNADLSTTDLCGVNYQKYFMPSVANVVGTDLKGYKVVAKNQFACNLMHVGRDECLPIALHKGEHPIIVSPAYYCFEVKDESKILPDYLFLWFKRKEFDREACFYTDADVRQGLIKSSFLDMKVNVLPIEEQRKIVSEYQTIEQRIENNRRLIATLEATAQAIYRKMFVDDIDPENLPEGWRMGTIGDLADFITAGTVPQYVENSNSLVLGQKCNYSHTIDLQKARPHIPKASAIQCQYGDTLINSTGDGTLGRVGLIKFSPSELNFDSNMTMIRPVTDSWIEYTFFVIVNLEQYFVNICQGSTNQTRLYCSMVRPIQCYIPKEDAIISFHKKCEPIIKLQGLAENEIVLLNKIKLFLLNKLTKL